MPQDKKISRKKIDSGNLEHFRYFEKMDQVNRALQGTIDLEQVMKDVLDVLLSVFECDRAWLVYPCDPETTTWQTPMECTRSEYPGVFPIGIELPLDPVGGEVFRILRNAKGPVKFGPGAEYLVPAAMGEAFRVQSFIATALYPKVGKPWSFGLHQCSYARVWSSEEDQLFQEIGRRLSDTLTSLLAYRNLQESEAQVKQLIDTSPLAMLVSSGNDQKVELINDKFIELFGYTLADMPDVEHWWPLAYPDEKYREEIRAKWQAQIEKAITDRGQIGPIEATVLCKDGSRRYIEFYFSSIGEKHLVTFTDLTERKRMEEEISASEAELRTLIHSMTDIVFVGNAEGRFLKIVDTSPSLLYKPPKEMLGKTLHEVFPKDLADFFLSQLREALATQKSVNFEYSIPIGDTVMWFYATVSPIPGDQTLMVARDITERKRNERELITLNYAINQSSDAVFMIDEQLTFVYVNDAACRSLGYSREEFLTMGPSDIDATITYDAAKDIMSKQFAAGSFPRFETQHKTRDGRIFPVEVSSSVVEYDGAKFSLTTVHDITERKQAENAIKEREKHSQSLLRLSHKLERAQTYAEALSAAQDEVRDVVGYQNLWAYLFTPDKRQAKALFAKGPNSDIVMSEDGTATLAIQGDRMMEEIVETRDIVIVEDAQTDERTDKKIVEKMKNRTLVNIPILLFDMHMGSIGVGTFGDEGVLIPTASQQEYLKALASHMAVTLDRIHLLEERRQAEQSLRASEEKYRALAENIPNVVYQCKNDSRYTFIYLNNAVERLTGYSKSDFIEEGLSFFDLYHPDDIKNMPTPKENNIREINHNPFHVTYRIRHKSGEWRWVDEWGTGVVGPSGKVEYLEGIMADITERKLAEQTLLESEERYRQLVNLSPDAIGIHKQGIIVYANPAMLHISGSKHAEDLVGKPVLEFIHQDFHEIIQKRIIGELGDNVDTFVEEKFIKLDGSLVDVEVAAVPYEYQGQRYTQVIARDITQRKQHEREREAIISVSAALRQAGTKTGILNIILDQLVSLFEVDGAMLVMPNAQTDGFINEMGRGVVGERMTGLVIPAGKGVCSWVTANKTAYLNNHADQDPLFYRPELLGNSHCVACTPLLAQEQVIGALWLARQMDFVEQDIRLLTAIADIAANAIHRVMLHEQTELQLHHLIALHQIDVAISSNFDSDLTLNVILHNVKNELEMDAVDILLISPVTHTLDFVAGLGFRTRGIEQSHVKLADGFAGTAAQEYRTVSCPDLKLARGTFSRSSLLADEEFVAHFATPLVVKGQVKGVLELFHRKAFEPESNWVDYFEMLATQAAIAIESASLFENLQRSNSELILAYDATIEGWSRALDLRDKETEGHTQRVTDMALALADKVGISEVEKQHLWRGSLLHDIGKMGVPDSILLKPGPLSEAEKQIMRQHPLYAYQMLSPIAYLKPALEISYCHHEKWDGSGYPRGLKGEEIPLSARLFAVVDVFDALTSDRPYRSAWPRDDVYGYIQEQSGKHFDPQIVKIVLENKMW